MPPAQTNSFQTFSPTHLGAMAVLALLCVAVCLAGRHARSAATRRRIGYGIAIILLANELVFYAQGLLTRPLSEFLAHFLPIHICGVAVYLVVLTLWRRGQSVYEVAYFWGLAGTAQAILTPNITSDFPTYQFMQYFLTHGGIVIGAVYATWALGMRPQQGSVLRVFLLTNLYAVAIGLVNWATGWNYMFLREPPMGHSPFFFLPWPWYILFIDCAALAMLALLYLPFRSRRNATTA